MGSESKPFDMKLLQQKLFIPGTKKRKIFGLLERPNLPPSVPLVSYKVFVCGRTGSGKTHLINRLAGYETQCVETAGLQVIQVYWLMKIANKLLLFRLELWDAGEAATRKYNHIKPACLEAVDAVLVCFSIASRDQWKELPQLISSVSQPSERPALMVVATRWERVSSISVSESELTSFESEHKIPILRLPPSTSSASEELSAMAPILNLICRQLWQRDQQLLGTK